MITAIVVSDNFVLRAGYRTWLGTELDIRVIAELGLSRRAIDDLVRHPSDVVIVDHDPPHVDTITFLELVANADIPTRVVVVSDVYDYHSVQRMMDVGASGYLCKNLPPSMLVTAIKSVAAGERFVDPILIATFISAQSRQLSAREVEVLQLVGDGLSNRMIAEQLELAESTVRSRVRGSMQKLRADSRSEAVAKALRSSLIH